MLPLPPASYALDSRSHIQAEGLLRQDPFAQALLISITAELTGQFVLVLILVRRELALCYSRADMLP